MFDKMSEICYYILCRKKSNVKYGGVAQLGEHLPCTQGVRSSILLISTILVLNCTVSTLKTA